MMDADADGYITFGEFKSAMKVSQADGFLPNMLRLLSLQLKLLPVCLPLQ